MDADDLLGLTIDLDYALRQLRRFGDARRALVALERVREKLGEAIDRAAEDRTRAVTGHTIPFVRVVPTPDAPRPA